MEIYTTQHITQHPQELRLSTSRKPFSAFACFVRISGEATVRDVAMRTSLRVLKQATLRFAAQRAAADFWANIFKNVGKTILPVSLAHRLANQNLGEIYGFVKVPR